MENELDKYPKGFLPNYFKKIGIGIMVLAFIPIILFKLMDIEFFQTQKEIFKMLALNSFILGLFFVVWSKDKIEDELKIIIRLKSFAAAVMLAVTMVIITPIIDLIFHEPLGDYTGRSIVLLMLFVHQVFYYSMKRKI
jgi:hypothetical protein